MFLTWDLSKSELNQCVLLYTQVTCNSSTLSADKALCDYNQVLQGIDIPRFLKNWGAQHTRVGVQTIVHFFWGGLRCQVKNKFWEIFEYFWVNLKKKSSVPLVQCRNAAPIFFPGATVTTYRRWIGCWLDRDHHYASIVTVYFNDLLSLYLGGNICFLLLYTTLTLSDTFMHRDQQIPLTGVN